MFIAQNISNQKAQTMTKKSTFQNASNLGATFTQLLRNEKPFGHQQGKFFHHLSKYFFLAELFTNVKLRAEQIPAYIQTLSDSFRKIINADVRYRQRQDDLPCAVGCRAFGVAPLGGGWYSPNIKVACNNAQVLEYICRQWCKRTNQYPHTISVQFDKVSNATKAMPRMPDKYSNYWDSSNRHIRKDAHYIIEECYLSMPFRLEYYATQQGFIALQFGSACRIVCTDDCIFDNYNQLSLNPSNRTHIISDCFAVNGMRAVQSWGHYNRPKTEKQIPPPLKKVRHLYGGNSDKQASLYYRACRAGFIKFNAYVYGRLKAGQQEYIPIERNCKPLDDNLDDIVLTDADRQEWNAKMERMDKRIAKLKQ